MKKVAFFLLMLISAPTFAQTEETSDVQKIFDFFYKKGVDISNSVNYFLYEEVFKWYNTPYRYAGNTLSGIDCSGFVKMIYNKVFEKILNGGSRDIFTLCNEVPKEELQEGDLVFFNIRGNGISHIGVYLMEGKFAHASTQLGVIVSDLSDDYYKRTFFKAGRLKEQSN